LFELGNLYDVDNTGSLLKVRTAIRVILVNVSILNVLIEGHKEVNEKQKKGQKQ
jgi:hypothetical protein